MERIEQGPANYWNAGIYGKRFSCRFNRLLEGTPEELIVKVNKLWEEWQQLEPIRRTDKYSYNHGTQ